jgi:hypothetical protein
MLTQFAIGQGDSYSFSLKSEEDNIYVTIKNHLYIDLEAELNKAKGFPDEQLTILKDSFIINNC